MRKFIVLLLVAALFTLAAAPAIGAMAKAPPGLHKAPAMYRADPHGSCLYCHPASALNAHVFCARCHTNPMMAPCTGAGCHGPS